MRDIAVIGSSMKENEKRVPIHPEHLTKVPKELRTHLHFEKGYGELFGFSDDEVNELTQNPLLSRDELLGNFKSILITKPVQEDFDQLSQGAMVCGWIHAVQQPQVTQTGIDKELTYISWENMYFHGSREKIHIFNRNNELAGYCSTQHALQLMGIDGNYGQYKKVAVLSMGSVGRGAIFALKGHGFTNITLYTRRPSYLIGKKIPGTRIKQFMRDDIEGHKVIDVMGNKIPLINDLASSDIIINCVLQNPNDPVMFLKASDLDLLKNNCLLVDVSCDSGMGFCCAQPTSFENPINKLGHVYYYGVDHTPSLLWNSASWEISLALLPHLESLIKEKANETIDRAVDIKDGKILNKDIFAFQNRAQEYPYPVV